MQLSAMLVMSRYLTSVAHHHVIDSGHWSEIAGIIIREQHD